MKKGTFLLSLLSLSLPGNILALSSSPDVVSIMQQETTDLVTPNNVINEINDQVVIYQIDTTTATGEVPVTVSSRTGVFSSGRTPEERERRRRTNKAPLPELSADSIRALKKQRGLTNTSTPFVPQGQWIGGISASFSTHSNDNYKFIVIEGINSQGHTVKVSPVVGYAFRNNMAIGARFTYSRTFLSVDSGSILLGDEDTGVDLKVDSYYSLEHTYEGALIWRQYIPFGRSKRFALFDEMQLSIGSSQAKFTEGNPVRGTYETGKHFSLGISPGLVAFATNNMAVELNVGVVGFTYNKVHQVHNQVTVGNRSSGSINFRVNVFSIGLGVAFYL